jgi:prophage antirepressor-like protein
VTGEVLPSIRKTGGYSREPRTQILPPISDQVQDVALNLRIVTETRQSFGCKASQQMWFKLNLPTVPAMFEPTGQIVLPFPSAAEARP